MQDISTAISRKHLGDVA